MRRVAAALITLGVLAGACANTDRYEPKFGAARVIAQVDYARAITTSPPTGYPVDGWGDALGAATNGAATYTSERDAVDGRLRVRRGGDVLWDGPRVNKEKPTGHLALDTKDNLLIAVGARLLQLDPDGLRTQTPKVVSDGWVNPNAFTVDARNRVWVADAAPRGGKSFVARGKENDHAKRRRFATALPIGSKPSAVTVISDEVFVCRSQQRDVYRLHIGLDNVARRRGVVPGLKCDGAIASLADGSIVTATAHDVRRYPPA